MRKIIDIDILEMEQVLSRGIIPDLFNRRVERGTTLTFQVIAVREMIRNGVRNGYRLNLSDGQYTNQYIVYTGQRLHGLRANCIIQGMKGRNRA